MKIGIDIRNIGKKRTGDEAVFLNLVKNLAKIDNENEYLLFTDTDDRTVIQYAESNLGIEGKSNFKIVSLNTANKFTWNFWTLPNYLRQNPVEVYHTQYILPFFVPKKVMLVTHIHDISFNFYPQFIKWSDLIFLKILIPWSIRKADRVLTVSEFTKRELVRHYKAAESKIGVIYNAIGDNFRKEYPAAEQEAVRKKYALPEKYFLYVGTLQPRKNIPFLIDAFAGLKVRLPEHKLVLVGAKGSHNYDIRIDERIRRNALEAEVIFTGYIESQDLPALYKGAEIFIFPSLYEGFGIPLLEAMAAGTPVAASRIPAHEEVAGEAAQYFDPERLDEAVEMIYSITVNGEKKEKLVNSGNSRVAFFSWIRSAEELLKIYNSL